MPSLALTGGLGTGKTTVLGMFRRLGAQTVNIDLLVHEALNEPAMIKRVVSLLGPDVLRKGKKGITINRQRVADAIFRDSHKRRSMEKLIHPIVLRKVRSTIRKVLNSDPSALVVCEVPLLFEAGYERYFDTVAVVSCSKKTALARLVKRGLSLEDATERMKSQMPLSKKKECADFVINNGDNLKKTETRVRRAYKSLSVRAAP